MFTYARAWVTLLSPLQVTLAIDVPIPTLPAHSLPDPRAAEQWMSQYAETYAGESTKRGHDGNVGRSWIARPAC